MQLKHLGPYEIGKPLGKGGMGLVYEAIDTTTGQRVAVKVLSPHLATSEGFRERFEAEIESLKTLRHDGIVRLFGYGEQDGVLFYSMEHVEGVSLEDELRAGRRFDWREVTSFAIQLSLALKHAHDHGIIHRDIKPANILLYDDDKVKLADFGIARLFGTTQLTIAGGVLGTADYMSPEQAEGRPVTPRCDQYSLGGVMYALLAGRPPFRAKNLPQMLQFQRFAQPEPVRRFAPDTPEQLDHLIQQLLAKDPADRFPNTQVLARHLQAMYKALSRPAADGFSLGSDQGRLDPNDPNWEYSLISKPTSTDRAVEAPPDSEKQLIKDRNAKRAMGDPVLQDATTLAADERTSAKSVKIAATNPPVAGVARSSSETKLADSPHPAHFTTVEAEESRQQAEHKRSWLLTVGQLIVPVAMLAGMSILAIYLSQPLTADQLYRKVRSEIDVNSGDSLVAVEDEINDFLSRFPNDPRVAELKRYQDRISLDKMERRLRNAEASLLLPQETLYLRADKLAEESPEDAVAMLQSLVDLYGTSTYPEAGPNSASTKAGRHDREQQDRQVACVQLAERRLVSLRAHLSKQVEWQLALLRERLDTAERLAGTNPAQAAAMYQAIIRLHEQHSWANEIVAESRHRLAATKEQE